jgi:hypothetical protein
MEQVNTNPYQEAIPPEGFLKVLWINPHSGWGYIPGDIVNLSSDKARNLIEEEFVRELSSEEYNQILEERKPKPPAPDSDYVKVKFLKAAPGFAYSEGDEGFVMLGNCQKLLEGGFIELAKDGKPRGQKIFTRLFK